MVLKDGDFIRINYTGKLADGSVFDTTVESVAKEVHLDTEKSAFKPVVICLGEGHLLKGLDAALVGKEPGKHTIALPAEKAFGKKSAKLLQLIPMRQLKKQNINPVPGMELNIDDRYGVVRTVSGGRVIVDFNHPLASQDLTYDIEVIEVISDLKTQVQAIFDVSSIPYKEIKVEGKHAIITMGTMLPQEFTDVMQKRITKLTAIDTVSFEAGKKPTKTSEDGSTENKV